MLGSHPISAVLGSGITAEEETPIIKRYIKALTSTCGMSLVLYDPVDDTVVDVRSKPQQKKDQLAWDELLTTQGKESSPFPAGIKLATNDSPYLGRQVTSFRKKNGEDHPVYLAAHIGESNLIVIDCESADATSHFLKLWAQAENNHKLEDAAPTLVFPHSSGSRGIFIFTRADIPKPLDYDGATIDTDKGESILVLWGESLLQLPPGNAVYTNGFNTLSGPIFPVGPVQDMSTALWSALSSTGTAR